MICVTNLAKNWRNFFLKTKKVRIKGFKFKHVFVFEKKKKYETTFSDNITYAHHTTDKILLLSSY